MLFILMVVMLVPLMIVMARYVYGYDTFCLRNLVTLSPSVNFPWRIVKAASSCKWYKTPGLQQIGLCPSCVSKDKHPNQRHVNGRCYHREAFLPIYIIHFPIVRSARRWVALLFNCVSLLIYFTISIFFDNYLYFQKYKNIIYNQTKEEITFSKRCWYM